MEVIVTAPDDVIEAPEVILKPQADGMNAMPLEDGHIDQISSLIKQVRQ
jgi:hypothetical protein